MELTGMNMMQTSRSSWLSILIPAHAPVSFLKRVCMRDKEIPNGSFDLPTHYPQSERKINYPTGISRPGNYYSLPTVLVMMYGFARMWVL